MGRTRGKARNNDLMIDEDFFMNLPTIKLKDKMKQAVAKHINALEDSGTNLNEFKDKKGLTAKIAEHLREKKVGGWVDLQVKYQKPSEYRMYKSLVDRVTYELKQRSQPQEVIATGVTVDSQEKSSVDCTSNPIDATAVYYEPDNYTSPSKKTEPASETSSESNEDILEQIEILKKRLRK